MLRYPANGDGLNRYEEKTIETKRYTCTKIFKVATEKLKRLNKHSKS